MINNRIKDILREFGGKLFDGLDAIENIDTLLFNIWVELPIEDWAFFDNPQGRENGFLYLSPERMKAGS